jgi:hypothetical protein
LAARSSPVRRQDRIRFSYCIHSSGFSDPAIKVLRGDEETVEAELRRIDGACWDNASAAAGDSSVGGWRTEGAICYLLKFGMDLGRKAAVAMGGLRRALVNGV